MKSIKRGIKKDFDKIPCKPKNDFLSAAGVTDKASRKSSLGVWKIIPAVALCVLFLTAGATLAFALDNTALGTQIKGFLGIEAAPVVSDSCSKEQNICFIDDVYHKDGGYVSEISDIAKIIGTDFYYPAELDSCDGLSVIYNIRYYVRPSDLETQIEFNNLQFTKVYDSDKKFWVDFHYKQPIENVPDDVIYTAWGTDFVIRRNIYGKDENLYLTKGVIGDNTYTFLAESVENAKQIIDSFTITDSQTLRAETVS
ncbi:MAG: hypothetical protein IKU23_08405 [Clostridia bacterium]|nr:hypothetical protein [Clostridia bacterium]MBR5279260.1 hypothetical protein [Clostridia bacterium]